MPPGEPARLTVLAGPSGVGKGSVAALLVQRFPQVYLSVSATTRPARTGEVDGVNYHFLQPAAFQALVDGNQMLEWAEYAGHRYGTIGHLVSEATELGRPALLEIDLAGARQVRQSMPSALQVFLAPPSFAELKRRLVQRGTDSHSVIKRRLQVARLELAAQGEFDHIVVNDQLERAVTQLAQVMRLD